MNEDFFKKIYLSFILKVYVWEGVGDWTKIALYWPPLLWPPVLCLSCSPGQLNRRPRGPALCWMMAFFTASYHQLVSKTPSGVPMAPSAGCGSLYHIWTPTVWLPVLTDLYNSSTPTQSLEWHVWSSSSGNDCHAVQRSLSSGASVYECIMGFYLVPFHQPNLPTRSVLITGHWNMSLPSGASLWNGMFARAEGQYITIDVHFMKCWPLCVCRRVSSNHCGNLYPLHPG